MTEASTSETEVEPVLAADGVRVERGDTVILADVSLSVPPGARILIRGESGAGKTTLFDVLGLLATPTAGSIHVDGRDAAALPERDRARIRRETIGIVFQDYQLVPDLTARENAAVPQEHTGDRDEAWLETLFDRLAIRDLAEQYPATLSGGEKRRVAIARALANRPAVVLADEPTGQLDPETADRVLSLLFDLQAETETALVVVSHDPALEARFDRTLRLVDSGLVHPDRES